MKLLKWKDTIQKSVPKEDILQEAEKSEIIYLVATGAWTLTALLGVLFIVIVPAGSKASFLGLALAVICGMGYMESAIKGYLKLERYKALWDKLDLMQKEMNQMEAEDL